MTTITPLYRKLTAAPAPPTEREAFLAWLRGHMRLTPFDATANAGAVAGFVGNGPADVCQRLAEAKPELVELFACDGEEFADLPTLSAWINAGAFRQWSDVEICVRNDAEAIFEALFGEGE